MHGRHWSGPFLFLMKFTPFHRYFFQHLLRFLEVFRTVPVLLMTATLPSERKEALERVCLDRGGLSIIQGPRVREEAKRYLLQRLPEQEAWNYVQHTLAKREKVLWVVNTVDRAINLAHQALEQGLPVQPFHSRYRYRDRLVRQRQVIDGFSPERGALLAITTQVAEISLDISADLLVTEYAPMASLIQRLGRLNRFVEVPEEVKPAIFLRPENAFPYAGKDAGEKYWGPIEKWLDLSATGLPRSQRDLAAAFIEVERNDSQLIEDHIFCDWLDDPWSSLSNRHPLMESVIEPPSRRAPWATLRASHSYFSPHMECRQKLSPHSLGFLQQNRLILGPAAGFIGAATADDR